VGSGLGELLCVLAIDARAADSEGLGHAAFNWRRVREAFT